MDLEAPNEYEEERNHNVAAQCLQKCTHVTGEDNAPQENAFQVEKFGAKKVVNLVQQHDVQEIDDRERESDSNHYFRQPRNKSYWICVKVARQAIFKILLFVCGLATLGLKIKLLGTWHDGPSILVVALVSILFESIVIHMQEFRFLNIKENAREIIKVSVTRGGRRSRLALCDLVVGDIIHLKSGDQVPADGRFISGHSLYINQSSLTGESDLIHVNPSRPFLLSGSKVCDGYGEMLVTSVGMASILDADGGEETLLEKKVRGGVICAGIVGFGLAVVVFAASLIHHFLSLTKNSGSSWGFKLEQTSRSDTAETFLGIIESILVYMLVVVPKNLLVAVPFSLAHATKSMIVKNALARRRGACETMAHVTSLCTDVTGILTLDEKVVTKAWVTGSMRDIASDLKDIAPSHLILLMEAILRNSSGSWLLPEVAGSSTERAAFVWGLQSGLNYKDLGAPSPILQAESSSSIKRMAGVALHIVESGKVHVHWKGAADAILDKCNKVAYPDGSIEQMNLTGKTELLGVIEGMAAESLHCIAFCYMQIDEAVVHSAHENDKWTIPEEGLTLLAILGIKDPSRFEVPEAVRQLQAAGIKVRMITSHSIGTAKAIATNCGILQDGNIAVEGSTFQADFNTMTKRKLSDLTVMAASSPADKLLMLRKLKEWGEVVAVVDAKADGPLLREADIGLTLGVQGTAIAIENSDIIITNDNLASIPETVRYARTLHLNLKKILQFQIAALLTASVVSFVSFLATGDLPMTGAQLLWANLIVVEMGVVALAQEPPNHNILGKSPVKISEPLLSNIMWRNLLLQVFYQVLMLLYVQYRGTHRLRLKGAEANNVIQTILFTMYVFCQLFNLVNARAIEEINIFQGIAANWLLLWGVSGELVVVDKECDPRASTSFTQIVDKVFDPDAMLIEHKNFEHLGTVEGGDGDNSFRKQPRDRATGTEPDPQHLFVLVDLRELQREIGDAQCQHADLGSICRFLGSLTCMDFMDAQAALGGVRLCICNFSTNPQPDTGVGGVPSWNMYVDDLAKAAITVAYEFMVAGGVIIALCMPEQYITIVQEVQDNGFELIRTMYLHMNAPMFILCKEYTEPTQTLLLAMFVRGRDIGLWRYNRAVDQEAASDDGIGERVDMLWEPSASNTFKPWRTYHNGEPLRPDIKKSIQFAR
ncbi:hypothetical protein L7F22_060464 [Adiantum nelumboides]|nr:hypothetical protein [Adiantum nelumboides]